MYKLLFFLLLFVTNLTFAQKNKATGFIININGDTIKGHFKLGMPATNSLKIQFQSEKETEMRPYVPFALKKWKLDTEPYYNESKYFTYADGGQAYGVFMKALITGEVSYYQYFNPSSELGLNEFFLEKGGKLTLIKTSKYYNQLADYFKDATELSEKIKNKKFKKSQTAQIVQAYNEWLEVQWK
jgi:hypothetical protein